MIKKIFKILMWIVLLGASLFLLSFVNSKYDQITLKKISVDFNADYKHDFITKEEVKEHLSDIGLQIDESLKKDIDLNRIENIFSNHPGVKKAEVFFVNNGHLKIEIEKRVPVGRVVSSSIDKNYYIDDSGEIMPLCSTYVAKVPVFTGAIKHASFQKNSNSDTNMHYQPIDVLYAMSKLINNDSFLKSQILQIHINNYGYFELIPRIGNQRILFGNAENMEEKFRKIKLFYANGPHPKELNVYDTLNVMYSNQIICSKRNN